MYATHATQNGYTGKLKLQHERLVAATCIVAAVVCVEKAFARRQLTVSAVADTENQFIAFDGRQSHTYTHTHMHRE